MSRTPRQPTQSIPPRYKGARRRTHSSGYIQEHCPDHPACNRFGMVMFHRLLMEQALGRYLTGAEVVHHENGDRTDNRIENLRLFPDQAAHMRHHQQQTAKRYDPDVIASVRAAASEPGVRQKDLGMSPQTVISICQEHGIEWKKPDRQHLDEDTVREALRGRTTLEAAALLGCNHQTLRNHWDHLLVKRKSPTFRKRSK